MKIQPEINKLQKIQSHITENQTLSADSRQYWAKNAQSILTDIQKKLDDILPAGETSATDRENEAEAQELFELSGSHGQAPASTGTTVDGDDDDAWADELFELAGGGR